MKKCILISVCLLFICSLQAQTKKQGQTNTKKELQFERKGKFLIETGYALAAGVYKGTGINVLLNEDGAITSIGIDGGYFVSNRLAIKCAIGVFASNLSIANFSFGPKYYIADKIPVELYVGIQNNAGDPIPQLNINIGYAIKLANNINLEPKIGFLGSNGGNLQFGTKFAMFL